MKQNRCFRNWESANNKNIGRKFSKLKIASMNINYDNAQQTRIFTGTTDVSVITLEDAPT